MRLTVRAAASALFAAALFVACSPKANTPTAGGGTGGGPITDRSSTISFYHLLMTNTALSSAVTFKANTFTFGAGTAYLGASLDNSVAWASSSPLVPFEVTDGGITRLVAQGKLLTNSVGHSAIVIGVNGSSDPNMQPSIVLAVKDAVVPIAGTAHVRWLHAWPNIGAVDIWSGLAGFEVRVVQNLAYGQITAYSDITAATPTTSLRVIITPAGVARGVSDFANITSITQVTVGNAYLLPLIYTSSSLASPGTKSIGIFQER